MPALNTSEKVPSWLNISNYFKHINEPAEFLFKLFDPIKLANIFMIFLPLLFLPIFGWRILICCLAVFGVGMLSGAPPTYLSYMLYRYLNY